MTKIYTRTGDQGTTGLYGGKRLPKHDVRIEAYGTVDELNAMLGAAHALLPIDLDLPLEISPMLEIIQKDLFDIGAHLATPYEANQAPASLPIIRPDAVTWLEDTIDRLDDELEPLKNFILPGGSQAGSSIHVARTVCRRAERRISTLAETEYVNPYILKYMNRLSDHLFTLARVLNHDAGKPEIHWL